MLGRRSHRRREARASQELEIFRTQGCAHCHTVDYGPGSGLTNMVPDEGFNGPEFSDFAPRRAFGGASLPQQGETYRQAHTRWLADPLGVAGSLHARSARYPSTTSAGGSMIASPGTPRPL